VVRQLLALVQGQVALLVEGDLVLAHQVDAPGRADARQRGRDDVRVDQVGPVAFQPEQHRGVGAVAAPGQRQRAEHLGADAGDVGQLARVEQPAVDEAFGRAHRAHGVRGTRADADLEQVERADGHCVVRAAWRNRYSTGSPLTAPPAAQHLTWMGYREWA